MSNDLTLDCENIYKEKEMLRGDRGRLEEREKTLAVNQDIFQTMRTKEETCMNIQKGEFEIAQIFFRKGRVKFEENKRIFKVNQDDFHLTRTKD